MAGWWKFFAYNRESLYGYGTGVEARIYMDMLNANRVYAEYDVELLTDVEAKRLGLGGNSDDTGFSLGEALTEA